MNNSNKEEHSKALSEPGSILPKLAEDQTQSETLAEKETGAAQSLGEEPPEGGAPQPTPAEESQLPSGQNVEMSGPETLSSELRDAPSAIALEPPPSAGEQRKPRSLFPALAATAIAGAALGVGASLALLYFAGPQIVRVFSQEGAPDSRIAALSAQIEALERKGDSASAAGSAALTALEQRVVAAENTAGSAAETANSAKAEAEKAATAAQQLASSSTPAEEANLGPLETRLATLEQKVTSLEAAPATPKTAVRAQPERENAAVQQASRAQAIAVVSQSLLRRLESGGEFSNELAALESLGVQDSNLAQLRAIHGFAVSSQRQLAAQFAALAPKIIASESADHAGGKENFLESLTRHVKGLVHVRRLGDAEATDVRSLVARIQDSLKDHELEAALSTWQQLPPAARNVSESWAEAMKARSDGLKAARAIEAEAVAALGKPKT